MEYRERVGRACKHIIDHGRALYLRSLGYTDAAVYTYCDLVDSLENALLMGRKGDASK